MSCVDRRQALRSEGSRKRFKASGRPRGWRKVAAVPEMEPVDRYVSLTTLDEAKKKKSGNNRPQVQWSDRDVGGKRRDREGIANGPGTSNECM